MTSRRVVLVLLCALLGLAAPFPADASPAQAAPPSPGAFTDYLGCVRGQGGGDLMILIDTSSSLGGPGRAGSDPGPDPARVTAATYLVQRLNELAGRGRLALDVQVAGFASTFAGGDWSRLTGADPSAVTAEVAAFADRNDGFETDYWTALEGARRSLADHVRATAPGRCQAIAWFTDGALDLTPRTTAADRAQYDTTRPYAPGSDLTTPDGTARAIGLAAGALCRPGSGLADQLRAANVSMFAVGLSNPAPGASEPDFSLLQGIATGGPGACGDRPPRGTFVPAKDIDDLLFGYDEILPPGSRCDAGAPECAGGHRFVLDDSVDAVHVLAQVEQPGAEALLIGPDGVAHALPRTGSGPADLGGVSATWRWVSTNTLEADLRRTGPGAGWSGVWTLGFGRPGSPTSGPLRSNVHISGDVLPGWTNQPPAGLTVGAPAVEARFGLVRADGRPARPAASLPGQLGFDATLVGPNGAALPLAARVSKDTLDRPVPIAVPSSFPAGPATLRMTLQLTTAPATPPGGGAPVPGTRLDAQQVDVPITVAAADGAPTVAGPAVFSGAEDATELTATVQVVGPAAGSGQVWVVPGDPATTITAAPEGASGVRVSSSSSAATPLVVGPGQRVPLELTLSVDRPANGTVAGSFPVLVAPQGRPDQARPVTVDFTGDLRTPLNLGVSLLVFVLVLLLALLIPALLIWLVKWWGARIPDDGLYLLRLPVTLEGPRVLRDGRDLVIRTEEYRTLATPESGGRRISHEGVVFRTRTGWSPWRPGFTEVEAPGFAVGTSTDPRPHGRRRVGRLPLDVHQRWVALVDPNAPEDAAEVLLLATALGGAAEYRALSDDVERRLPEVVTRVRAALDAAPAGPSDPGPGRSDGGWPPGPDDGWPPSGPDDGWPPSGPDGPGGPGRTPDRDPWAATRPGADPWSTAGASPTTPGSPTPPWQTAPAPWSAGDGDRTPERGFPAPRNPGTRPDAWPT